MMKIFEPFREKRGLLGIREYTEVYSNSKDKDQTAERYMRTVKIRIRQQRGICEQ